MSVVLTSEGIIDQSTFLTDILADCPGVDTPLATDRLRKSIREFCSKTQIYKHDIEDVDIVSGQSSYDSADGIAPPSDMEFILPYYVIFDGAPIDPVSANKMDNVNRYWRVGGLSRGYIFHPRQDRIMLTFTPVLSITDGLDAGFICRPTITGTKMPDVLNEWEEHIKAGALYRLRMMQKKPWSDKELAKMNAIHYYDGIRQARWRVEASNTKVDLSVNQRPLARGNGGRR